MNALGLVVQGSPQPSLSDLAGSSLYPRIVNLHAYGTTSQPDSGNACRPRSSEAVEHNVPRVGGGFYDVHQQLLRFLSWVLPLEWPNAREVPHVGEFDILR